jgi:hypothetical protein
MCRSASEPAFVLIGNPESRRTQLFDAALREAGLGPCHVVPYADIGAGGGGLGRLPAGAIVKIDSPGKNFAVEQMILRAGAAAAADQPLFACASADEIDLIPFRKGEILFPNQWHLGFSRVLGRIKSELAHAPAHHLMNDVGSAALMFDKPACHALLSNHNIPVPRSLTSPLSPMTSYEDLRARMSAAKCSRVFVKLAYGSSGSGVVALRTRDSESRATTTVELVREGSTLRLFNSRRIRTTSDPTEIRVLIDGLCRHRVHVEEWLPKAGIDGKTFDLRILTINGTPRHMVVRASRHPITNLHLLNARGEVSHVRSRLGERSWQRLMETCQRVSALFPRCLTVALDVLIRSDWNAHAILELNAFGDLLPNVLEAGEDVYTTQIKASLNARQSAALAAPALEAAP